MVMYFCITWGDYPYARSDNRASRDVIRRFIEREGSLNVDPPSSSHHSRPGYVPEFLDMIVMRLVAHRPEDRFYSNARAVINALATHMPDAFKDTQESLSSYLKPELDKYIGRDKEIGLVKKSIEELVKGEQPETPVFCAAGIDGIGKTHFLNCIKNYAEQYIEKISIKQIEEPPDEKKPTLFLIDNSKKSLFLRFVTERQKNPKLYSKMKPVMLVYTISSPSKGEGHLPADGLVAGGGGVKVIPLFPFTISDIHAYLSATPAFKGRDIPHDYVKTLHDITSGIPRELVETLEELDSKGIIFDAAGKLIPASAAGKHVRKLPKSTHARLLTKYKVLSLAEKEMLEFISCWCYRSFCPMPPVGEVADSLGRITTAQTIRTLTQKQILSSPNTEYMLNLVHEDLAEEKRVHFHDMVADHLRHHTFPSPFMGEGRLPADGLVAGGGGVAFHLSFGSNRELAIRNATILGRKLLYEQGRCALAIELLERAQQLTEPSRWKLFVYQLSLIAEAYFYNGNFSKASQIVKNALSLIKNKSITWEIKLKLSEIGYKLQWGKIEDAKEQIDQLKHEVAEKLFAHFMLLNLEGRYYFQLASKNPRQSQKYLEVAKNIYEDIDTCSYDIKNSFFPLVLRSIGQYRQASEKLEKQLAHHEINIFNLCAIYIMIADTCRLARQFDKAAKYASEALSLTTKNNLGRQMLDAHAVLAYIYHDTNDFEKSVTECNNQLTLYAFVDDEENYKRHSARLWTQIGHCYKELKKFDEAIAYFEAATKEGIEDNATMSAYQGLGEVYYHKGDFKRELKCFEQAEKLLEHMPENTFTNSHRSRIEELKKKTPRTEP